MKTNTLVIISVPLSRNIKCLLNSRLYERIKREYPVLIVSPFAKLKQFREEFGGENVSFMPFEKDSGQLNKYVRRLYNISESLRIIGCWYRLRKGKMEYYWDMIKRGYDASFQPINRKLRAIILQRIVGPFGSSRYSWRLIDVMFGRFFYDKKLLLEHTGKYNSAVVIQTANWGYQERYLAFCANRLGYRSIMLPYTTDQLTTNGHLISDFDKICIQGPVEYEYATQCHDVSSKRICKLGMLWMRNMEEWRPEDAIQPPGKGGKVKTILYAGVGSSFFPRESEHEAVRVILNAISSDVLPDTKLIYRPLAANKKEYDDIDSMFAKEKHIEIEYPSDTFIGTDGCNISIANIREEIVDYLNTIATMDVVVISGITSLLFDSLYYGVPTILNFADSTGSMEDRWNADLLIGNEPLGLFTCGIQKSRSFQELVRKIREAIYNPATHAEARQNILSAWDYPNKKYTEEFMSQLQQLSL